MKEKGDTYQQECLDSKAIAAALNLTSEQWKLISSPGSAPGMAAAPYD